jgi:hypothetical protein
MLLSEDYEMRYEQIWQLCRYFFFLDLHNTDAAVALTPPIWLHANNGFELGFNGLDRRQENGWERRLRLRPLAE